MVYEIWSVPTRNLVSTYDTEEEAWAAIRQIADRQGVEYLARLALTREAEDGQTTTLAVGVELRRAYGPQYA